MGAPVRAAESRCRDGFPARSSATRVGTAYATRGESPMPEYGYFLSGEEHTPAELVEQGRRP
ncbi:hypothetical protein GCM10010289_29130 [Streptomyces violascens]|uniref:Uncharacterized protein n=1 Tax=Streptomyces violascens TaxID=67381 RepID=A0ABQ3QUE7_9ACTN|nr:hypothetical protein GCM10010289_29130 [Streptomyces violascens]GHI40885.1 hypothetical protein Sviol_52930 [Streptomyces violascens]